MMAAQQTISHLQGLDYAAICIFVALMAFIGVWIGVFVKDIGSYFKGGSAIPWMMSSITNFMGLFSTFVFVAYAGIAYEHGLISIIVFCSTVPACMIGGLLAGRWRRTRHTTPMEFLEERYNLSLRQLFSWVGMVMRFLDNMIRLYAIGLFLTVVTPLSLEWAIVLSGIIVTVFNIFGGLWSVVVMSMIQFFVLLLVTFMLLPLSLDAVGGMGVLYEKLPEHMAWFNGPKGNFWWLFVYFLMIIIKYNENWAFIQKFYCVRDEKAARKVAYGTGVMFLLSAPVFIIPAISAQLLVPGLPDPEMAYVAVSKLLLPVGIMGIMVSAMFAATMSTLTSEYNIMSAVITTDIYKRLINPNVSEGRMLWVARIATAAIGVIIIFGAFYVKAFGGVFEANKLFTGIVAIPLGIPFIFGIVFKRPNSSVAYITIVAGIIAGIVFNTLPGVSWEWATMAEIAICLVCYFVVPLFIKRKSKEENVAVERFFERLQTPVGEKDKSVVTAGYKKVLVGISVLSVFVTGCLFVGMSAPSLHLYSGRLGLTLGIMCLLAAGVIWLIFRKRARSSV